MIVHVVLLLRCCFCCCVVAAADAVILPSVFALPSLEHLSISEEERERERMRERMRERERKRERKVHKCFPNRCLFTRMMILLEQMCCKDGLSPHLKAGFTIQRLGHGCSKS